jgi:hypothetical protein
LEVLQLILKKIISYIAILSITLSLVSLSNAQAAENSLSLNTVITEDNIYDVFNYLGLDSSTLIETNGDKKMIYKQLAN